MTIKVQFLMFLKLNKTDNQYLTLRHRLHKNSNMKDSFRKWMIVLFVLFHCTGFGQASCIGLDVLMRRVKSSCVVAHLTSECIDTDGKNDEFDEFLNLRNLSRSLSEDIGVFVGYIEISEKWADETPINNGELDVGDLVLFKKMKKKMNFLVPSPHPTHLDPIVYKRKEGHTSLIDFVNVECEIYITENGTLSEQGVHREEIHRERFHVKNISNVQFKDAFHPNCFKEGEFCEANRNNIYQDVEKLPECEKLENLPSKDEFFHKFVKKSKPVIFKNILRDWPAFTKWSNAYLRETFGEKHIRFQMSPSGDYEGVEPLSLWENAKRNELSLMNSDNLRFPDLVLVRPAPVNGTFSIFLDIIEGLLNGTLANFSAYFQYSSIPEYLPELEKDVREDMLFPGLFNNREELNIWLSDGNTRGKLHFDDYENFLCQVSN